MTTALILRPADSPKLWVLEVDGPRRKYVQRDEGYYYLNTNNHPMVDHLTRNMELAGHDVTDSRFKDWCEPCWEIYQMHDGRIEVHACRPSAEEAMEGDLNGELGSIIKIVWPCRPVLRNALRLARRLCKADPRVGILVSERDLVGIVVIETNIPVYCKKAA